MENELPEAVTRWLNGSRDARTELAVRLWASMHPGELEALQMVWANTRAPAGRSTWADVRPRLTRQHDSEPNRQPQVRPTAHVLRRAAIAVTALGLGVLAAQLFNAVRPNALTVIDVPVAARANIELPGGVAVLVNAGSRLSFDGRRAGRDVQLQGEAFFRVHPDSSRRFHVRTASGTVSNIGTEFTVRARGGTLSVAVLKGTVELTTDSASVRVLGGWRGETSAGGRSRVVPLADPAQPLAWTRRELVFVDDRLAEVAQEIERQFGATVRVATQFENARISAQFSGNTGAAAVIEAICRVAAATCERNHDSWTIGFTRTGSTSGGI